MGLKELIDLIGTEGRQVVIGVIKKDNPPVKMIDSANFIWQTFSLLLKTEIVSEKANLPVKMIDSENFILQTLSLLLVTHIISESS